MKKGKILIIAAHPDDEILGCGGTISKLKDTNDINVLFMTDGVSARGKNKKEIIKRKKACINLFKYLNLPRPIFFNFPDNEMDKISLLKITKKIEGKIKIYKPDTIFTHFENDLNIDHQITSKAVVTACRPIKNHTVKSIIFFEILSSTEWNISIKNKSFKPNYFVDISKSIKFKLKALKHYKKEMRKWPHPRSIEGVKLLSKTRGSTVGLQNAEAFILGRHIDK